MRMKAEANDLKIIVGTKESKLAMLQTNWMIKKLKKNNPLTEFEIKVIKSKGDIEQELLDGKVDIAVRSMKEMPLMLTEKLDFIIPLREDARNALILKAPYKGIEDLPQGAKIGTESKVNGYQIRVYREDLQTILVRGNIDTRIRMLQEEGLDGIILEMAGLKRLGLQEHITQCFSIDQMIPIPCQGILGIEVKEKNHQLVDIVRTIEDPISTIQYQAESAFMKAVNDSYQTPIGAYCRVEGTHMRLKALIGDEEGRHIVVKELCGPLGAQEDMGIQMASILKKALELRRF